MSTDKNSKQKSFEKTFLEFIGQADEIGKMCSDEAIKRSRNNFLAVDIHSKYAVWKEEVGVFLQLQNLRTDAKIFWIENAVPMVKGGIEYGDKDSTESRSLIKAISLELDEKLKHLRELYYRKQDSARRKIDSAQQPTFIFQFNRTNGELNRYPREIHKKSVPFSVGKGRYKVMVQLIEEKERGSSYVSTKELADVGKYKKDEKCREGIHAIREKVNSTFRDVKGKKFIESKQPEGYRIGLEINVFFEDTP